MHPSRSRSRTTSPGAQIYYTTNGDVPTQSNGVLYSGPVNVSKTTTLRARAFLAGYLPTNVDTQTYLFPSDIAQQTHQTTLAAGFPPTWGSFTGVDYGLDPDIVNNPVYGATLKDDLKSIPTLSIVLDIDDMFGPNGIYSNSNQRGVAWERATSVEWITNDGSPEFQVDAGVRIHGAYFRSNNNSRKHSFRLLFKDIYGLGKLDFPLIDGSAVDEFNTLVLSRSQRRVCVERCPIHRAIHARPIRPRSPAGRWPSEPEWHLRPSLYQWRVLGVI